MGIYARFHEHWVHGRRVRVLSESLAELLPPASTVLDIFVLAAVLARIREQRAA